MRVSGNSKSGSVAGAVAGILRTGEPATLEVIGVPAVYSAVKAIIITKAFLEKDRITPTIDISSEAKDVRGEEMTVITFTLTPHKTRTSRKQ